MLFRAPSRDGRGRRAAVDLAVCFGRGGFFRVFFSIFFYSNAHRLLQVWGRLASLTSILIYRYRYALTHVEDKLLLRARR